MIENKIIIILILALYGILSGIFVGISFSSALHGQTRAVLFLIAAFLMVLSPLLLQTKIFMSWYGVSLILWSIAVLFTLLYFSGILIKDMGYLIIFPAIVFGLLYINNIIYFVVKVIKLFSNY